MPSSLQCLNVLSTLSNRYFFSHRDNSLRTVLVGSTTPKRHSVSTSSWAVFYLWSRFSVNPQVNRCVRDHRSISTDAKGIWFRYSATYFTIHTWILSWNLKPVSERANIRTPVKTLRHGSTRQLKPGEIRFVAGQWVIHLNTCWLLSIQSQSWKHTYLVCDKSL